MCKECAYNTYTSGGNNCGSSKTGSGTYTVYVYPPGASCSGGNSCHYNLADALAWVDTNTKTWSSGTVDIILAKFGTSYHIWAQPGSTTAMNSKIEYLRSCNIALTIRAAVSPDTNPYTLASERPIVLVKAENIHTYSSKSITIKNIIFIGQNMVWPNQGNQNCHLAATGTNKICCTYSTYTANFGTALNCSNSGWTVYSTDLNGDYPDYDFGGLFNLQFRIGTGAAPAFTMTNVDFKNFAPYQNFTRSLLKFERGASITIAGVNFQDNYFPGGLISNYFVENLWQTSNQDDTQTFTRDCNQITGFSSLTTCLAITIQDSVFQNINSQKMKRVLTYNSLQSYAYSDLAEAYILHAFAIPAKIYLMNNQFKGAYPALTVSNDANMRSCNSSLYSSSPFKDVYNSQSAQKAAFDYLYKRDNTIMGMSGSHFLLRQFIGTLTMTGNTF